MENVSIQIREYQAKIDSAKKQQEAMKAANQIIRKKLPDEQKIKAITDLGFSPAQAARLLQKDFVGRIGFPTYQLTNNLANIKRMEEMIKELEKRAAAVDKEYDGPDGLRVVENTTADRLQLFFPSRPDAEKTALLKSRGFKWSPTNGCWQRQLTDNARWAVKNYFMSVVFLLLCCSPAFSQNTVKKDSTGIYVTAPKGFDDVVGAGIATKEKYRDSSGHVHTVYMSATGKLYVVRMSKKGNWYRFYLDVK